MTTDKEKFFHSMLITLHTYRWTGSPKFGDLINAIGAYSYAHTNSNIGDEDDKSDRAYETLVKNRDKVFNHA